MMPEIPQKVVGGLSGTSIVSIVAGSTLTEVNQILQTISFGVGIIVGAFAIYFYVKRLLNERRKNEAVKRLLNERRRK